MTTGRLAYHETLELHELLILKTNCLVNFKRHLARVTCTELRGLLLESVQLL